MSEIPAKQPVQKYCGGPEPVHGHQPECRATPSKMHRWTAGLDERSLSKVPLRARQGLYGSAILAPLSLTNGMWGISPMLLSTVSTPQAGGVARPTWWRNFEMCLLAVLRSGVLHVQGDGGPVPPHNGPHWAFLRPLGLLHRLRLLLIPLLDTTTR